ncbi:hypothetical protein TNCV_1628881 [Trichonephila clavipes]|nr:hypothetical protein TNCV_1628881 [Trichonephila clavipes]
MERLHPSKSTTREAVFQSFGKSRHDDYLEQTQNIALQHQGEDLTGNLATNYLQDYPYSNVFSGTPKRGFTSRLTGAGSFLLPAKGRPRKCKRHPQDTIFHHIGHCIQQICRSKIEKDH